MFHNLAIITLLVGTITVSSQKDGIQGKKDPFHQFEEILTLGSKSKNMEVHKKQNNVPRFQYDDPGKHSQMRMIEEFETALRNGEVDKETYENILRMCVLPKACVVHENKHLPPICDMCEKIKRKVKKHSLRNNPYNISKPSNVNEMWQAIADEVLSTSSVSEDDIHQDWFPWVRRQKKDKVQNKDTSRISERLKTTLKKILANNLQKTSDNSVHKSKATSNINKDIARIFGFKAKRGLNENDSDLSVIIRALLRCGRGCGKNLVEPDGRVLETKFKDATRCGCGKGLEYTDLTYNIGNLLRCGCGGRSFENNKDLLRCGCGGRGLEKVKDLLRCGCGGRGLENGDSLRCGCGGRGLENNLLRCGCGGRGLENVEDLLRCGCGGRDLENNLLRCGCGGQGLENVEDLLRCGCGGRGLENPLRCDSCQICDTCDSIESRDLPTQFKDLLRNSLKKHGKGSQNVKDPLRCDECQICDTCDSIEGRDLSTQFKNLLRNSLKKHGKGSQNIKDPLRCDECQICDTCDSIEGRDLPTQFKNLLRNSLKKHGKGSQNVKDPLRCDECQICDTCDSIEGRDLPTQFKDLLRNSLKKHGKGSQNAKDLLRCGCGGRGLENNEDLLRCGCGGRGLENLRCGCGGRGLENLRCGCGGRGLENLRCGCDGRSLENVNDLLRCGCGGRGLENNEDLLRCGCGGRGLENLRCGCGGRGLENLRCGCGGRGLENNDDLLKCGCGGRGLENLRCGCGGRGLENLRFGCGGRGLENLRCGCGGRGLENLRCGCGGRGLENNEDLLRCGCGGRGLENLRCGCGGRGLENVKDLLRCGCGGRGLENVKDLLRCDSCQICDTCDSIEGSDLPSQIKNLLRNSSKNRGKDLENDELLSKVKDLLSSQWYNTLMKPQQTNNNNKYQVQTSSSSSSEETANEDLTKSQFHKNVLNPNGKIRHNRGEHKRTSHLDIYLKYLTFLGQRYKVTDDMDAYIVNLPELDETLSKKLGSYKNRDNKQNHDHRQTAHDIEKISLNKYFENRGNNYNPAKRNEKRLRLYDEAGKNINPHGKDIIKLQLLKHKQQHTNKLNVLGLKKDKLPKNLDMFFDINKQSSQQQLIKKRPLLWRKSLSGQTSPAETNHKRSKRDIQNQFKKFEREDYNLQQYNDKRNKKQPSDDVLRLKYTKLEKNNKRAQTYNILNNMGLDDYVTDQLINEIKNRQKHPNNFETVASHLDLDDEPNYKNNKIQYRQNSPQDLLKRIQLEATKNYIPDSIERQSTGKKTKDSNADVDFIQQLINKLKMKYRLSNDVSVEILDLDDFKHKQSRMKDNVLELADLGNIPKMKTQYLRTESIDHKDKIKQVLIKDVMDYIKKRTQQIPPFLNSQQTKFIKQMSTELKNKNDDELKQQIHELLFDISATTGEKNKNINNFLRQGKKKQTLLQQLIDQSSKKYRPSNNEEAVVVSLDDFDQNSAKRQSDRANKLSNALSSLLSVALNKRQNRDDRAKETQDYIIKQVNDNDFPREFKAQVVELVDKYNNKKQNDELYRSQNAANSKQNLNNLEDIINDLGRIQNAEKYSFRDNDDKEELKISHDSLAQFKETLIKDVMDYITQKSNKLPIFLDVSQIKFIKRIIKQGKEHLKEKELRDQVNELLFGRYQHQHHTLTNKIEKDANNDEERNSNDIPNPWNKINAVVADLNNLNDINNIKIQRENLNVDSTLIDYINELKSAKQDLLSSYKGKHRIDNRQRNENINTIQQIINRLSNKHSRFKKHNLKSAPVINSEQVYLQTPDLHEKQYEENNDERKGTLDVNYIQKLVKSVRNELNLPNNLKVVVVDQEDSNGDRLQNYKNIKEESILDDYIRTLELTKNKLLQSKKDGYNRNNQDRALEIQRIINNLKNRYYPSNKAKTVMVDLDNIRHNKNEKQHIIDYLGSLQLQKNENALSKKRLHKSNNNENLAIFKSLGDNSNNRDDNFKLNLEDALKQLKNANKITYNFDKIQTIKHVRTTDKEKVKETLIQDVIKYIKKKSTRIPSFLDAHQIRFVKKLRQESNWDNDELEAQVYDLLFSDLDERTRIYSSGSKRNKKVLKGKYQPTITEQFKKNNLNKKVKMAINSKSRHPHNGKQRSRREGQNVQYGVPFEIDLSLLGQVFD